MKSVKFRKEINSFNTIVLLRSNNYMNVTFVAVDYVTRERWANYIYRFNKNSQKLVVENYSTSLNYYLHTRCDDC